jgi:hypothetical protein
MKIEIEYTDRSDTVVVEGVDGYTVDNGVLSAWHQGLYREDLGNWPLTQVRRYKVIKDSWGR